MDATPPLITLDDALEWVSRYGNVHWNVEELRKGLRSTPIKDIRQAMYAAKFLHHRPDEEVNKVILLLIMQ